MTAKQILIGLQSLRAVTPGLLFLGAALLLTVLPRRWSGALAGGTVVASSFLVLLTSVIGSNQKLPDRTDLVADQLSRSAPVWLAVVTPALAGCALRPGSQNQGLAAAALLFVAGSLCCAAAARTIALVYASLTLAAVGVAALGATSADETKAATVGARSSLMALFLWALLSVGLSLHPHMASAVTSTTVADLSPHPPISRIGSTLTSLAILGFLGAAPMSTWVSGASPGATAGVKGAMLLIGCATYLKLGPGVRSATAEPIVWAWSVYSALYFSLPARRSASITDAALRAHGVIASVAAGLLFADAGEQRTTPYVGAMALLLSLSLALPGSASAIEACQLDVAGSLGRPDRQRSSALRIALYVAMGFPLSLGFWGLRSIALSAFEHGIQAGRRQTAVAVVIVSLVLIGLRQLRNWSLLSHRPLLGPFDQDRWPVASSLYCSGILILIGCFPAPFFMALAAIMTAGAAELPSAPLNP